MSESDQTPPKTPEQVRNELAEQLFRRSNIMTAEYRNLISHTGGLLTQSMTVAYSRAINDVIKFLMQKGDNNEKSV